MKFGKLSPVLLDELAYYCRRLDVAEKKLYGADTFKGKEHVWVDKFVDEDEAFFVVYSSDQKKWYAEYFDMAGSAIFSYETDGPFDYKTKWKERKKLG